MRPEEEMSMKRIVTVIAAAMLLAAPVAFAQDQPAAPQQQEKQQGKESRRQQMSPEERAAAIDKRLERVKSNLKLTSEQAALWPPVEAALRQFANEAQEARQEMRAQREARSKDKDQEVDPIAMLRERADRMAERADVMKKLADAADPLYKILDDGQKQQLQRLMGAGGNRQGQRQNKPQRG
jgi:hypothetical protein